MISAVFESGLNFLNLFITFATFSKFAENAKLETLGTFFKEYGVLSVLIRSYLPSYPLYNTVLSSVHRQRLRGAQRTSSNFMLKKLTRRCMIPRMVMFRQLFYWLAGVWYSGEIDLPGYMMPQGGSVIFYNIVFIILFFTTIFYKNFFYTAFFL